MARLNQIDGVQSSSASVGHPDGALVQVYVRPGADPARISEEVQRVLSEEIKDRSPEELTSRAAAAALQQKEWLDQGQLATLAATDPGTSEGGAPLLLVALLLLAVVVGLLAWRHFRGRGADPSRPRPRFSQSP
jgi:hypothetical protein